jgi:malate synthase
MTSSFSSFFDLPQYHRFLGPEFARSLLSQSSPIEGVPGLRELGPSRGLETPESLAFLAELYREVREPLARVLAQREKDRAFIDERTRALFHWNQEQGIGISDPRYRTVIGLEDADGRVVIGPLRDDYARAGGAAVAALPEFLQGPHVTLFGPPDQAKLSINAMNAYHRRLPGEPPIVEALLRAQDLSPKWGADDEDSKTPIRSSLVDAGIHLKGCFDRTLAVGPEAAGSKRYELAQDHLALPIKRFPGLALPCSFLFLDESPIPLHLYDFALHLFEHWHRPEALVFYVPKLENEEEARYLQTMISAAERRIQALHSQYRLGTVRLMVVLENPRAILRTHEIMDALYPYFAGASLGWHDYLGSTARLFREDGHYRIPVKADPDIVIKYIQASHRLVADVVGSRGGIKIGGMYGILPVTPDLKSPSFQVTLLGYFRDVITQFKRNLNGFWVAHPDFVRLGLALVEAWKRRLAGDSTALVELCCGVLDEPYAGEILRFIDGPDIQGLDLGDPGYVRSLLVADLEESDTVPNHDPEEVRYNVFQSLQYLVDWLSGNGCVALPAIVRGTPVRVMDDLATAERSRWEVWHEIRHGRVPLEMLVRIAFEELRFIRKDLSDGKKIVQVRWDERTARWYPIALELMLLLMTAESPVEFATELLLPFTVERIRAAKDPLGEMRRLDPAKYALRPEVDRLIRYFEACGAVRFAKGMAALPAYDPEEGRRLVLSFSREEVIEAASFHGDIGEPKKHLDALAASEQAGVRADAAPDAEQVRRELQSLGSEYLQRHGFKFLVSARGRSGEDLLGLLRQRLTQNSETELELAREALWEIARKRLELSAPDALLKELGALQAQHGVRAVSLSISREGAQHEWTFGTERGTRFQLASLSKTIASAFAIEFLARAGIGLEDSVQALLIRWGSPFRLSADPRASSGPETLDPTAVRVRDLMSHSALNLHYVPGVSLEEPMPSLLALLEGRGWGYQRVAVISKPGSRFQYSGGGYLLLEHLVELVAGQPAAEAVQSFLRDAGVPGLTFNPARVPGEKVASGFFDGGRAVPGGRLQFPGFAAGALGTAGEMHAVLLHLEKADASLGGSGPISHDTAVRMVQGRDLGCREFMGCDMGVGVFIAEAGSNRILLHQGANEGFRALFLHVFAGPDRGKGFVLLCNADQSGVRFVAEAAQKLLLALKIQGVDSSRFLGDFDEQGIPQEQRVNLGYRDLVLQALERDLPERIEKRGPKDPLASVNLCGGARIERVSNQRFARAENLISDCLPVFDPELYGSQGKVMDSWESARHNPAGFDFLEMTLAQTRSLRFVALSTEFHDGNHPEAVRLLGRGAPDGEWQEFLPKTALQGHSQLKLRLPEETPPWNQIRVEMFPDGGLSRLGLYFQLPDSVAAEFALPSVARSIRVVTPIPKPRKPLTLPWEDSGSTTQAGKDQEVDWASLSQGGRVLFCSNEHYGPGSQVISPFPPLHMFDGFESARSRSAGHQEELVLALGRKVRIRRIVFDFTFFVNNNPQAVQVFARGSEADSWIELVPRTDVKAFAANQKEFQVIEPATFGFLRVLVFPDGGINRIRVWG